MATSKASRPKGKKKVSKAKGRTGTGTKKRAAKPKSSAKAAKKTAKKATKAPAKKTKKRAAPGARRTAPGRRRVPKKGVHRRTDVRALERRINKLSSLLDVAKAMTAERDLDSLLKMILNEAVRVVGADRCTLWIVDSERNELWTKVAQGLGTDEKIRIPIGVGIAGQVASGGKIINIRDAYADPRFNRQVDKDTGYSTRNILGVPMKSHTGEVTGVLQALNKLEAEGGFFTAEDEDLLLALGANAAAAIENAILYEEIDRLFEGFVKASVVAIESRDPTTSGHSERVAVFTLGIAEQLEKIEKGPYSHVVFTREDMQEIRYAALLHDFGKVGVRENVLVKANKLYPGQLETIETRFRALAAQRENQFLKATVTALRDGGQLPPDYEGSFQRDLAELNEYIEFIRACNRPTVLERGGFERLRDIGKVTYNDWDGNDQPVLDEVELDCLSIPRGSLDTQERLEIESHVTHTFRFLAQIPWTRNLRRVPDIAYAHHEKLDGAGYPRQLSADQIPVQSRMMTIADIYDALTASDRPYKKAVSHDKALAILFDEAKLKRIDKLLLNVFIDAKVHEAVVAGK